MRKLKQGISVLLLSTVLLTSACGQPKEQANKPTAEQAKATEAAAEQTAAESKPAASEATTAKTVKITDINGEVEVPVNPKSVVALDNRTFQTLADWGIKLAAVPKDVMYKDSPYVADKNLPDIGNHKAANLEVIAAANPDLVIIGQRFGKLEKKIRELVPQATVINLNWDVSKKAEHPGENLVNGLKQSTLILGKIFQKEAEADALVKSFEDAIAKAKAAYKPEQKVMSLVVSGGKIGFAAPKTGRVWGPLYEVFNWTPSLEIKDSSTNHKGDEISVEAIAETNPDWLFVLDRDAAVGGEGKPAKDVVENAPALQSVKAIQAKQVIYAPNDTYVNESIQTFTTIFNNIANAFAKAK